MKRGEVWWAQLPARVGRRPVLILSRDSMPAGRGEITVAYLTSTIRNSPVEVLLTPADGVSRTCVVNLRGLICTLSPAKMAEVKTAIIEALDLK
jgi:mRNA interferase MazF